MSFFPNLPVTHMDRLNADLPAFTKTWKITRSSLISQVILFPDKWADDYKKDRESHHNGYE